MDIDRRLEFLVRSTESLHASVQEMSVGIHELTVIARQPTKQLEIDAENIRRLANIAAAHEQRLDGLEGSTE